MHVCYTQIALMLGLCAFDLTAIIVRQADGFVHALCVI